jgi:hypothetical protein
MAVGKKDSDDISYSILEIAKVRQDHIDSWLVLFREEHTAVNN